MQEPFAMGVANVEWTLLCKTNHKIHHIYFGTFAFLCKLSSFSLNPASKKMKLVSLPSQILTETTVSMKQVSIYLHK